MQGRRLHGPEGEPSDLASVVVGRAWRRKLGSKPTLLLNIIPQPYGREEFARVIRKSVAIGEPDSAGKSFLKYRGAERPRP